MAFMGGSGLLESCGPPIARPARALREARPNDLGRRDRFRMCGVSGSRSRGDLPRMSKPGWTLSKPISAFFAAWRDMHVRQLIRVDANPNTLTTIGLGINLIAAIPFETGAHQ